MREKHAQLHIDINPDSILNPGPLGCAAAMLLTSSEIELHKFAVGPVPYRTVHDIRVQILPMIRMVDVFTCVGISPYDMSDENRHAGRRVSTQNKEKTVSKKALSKISIKSRLNCSHSGCDNAQDYYFGSMLVFAWFFALMWPVARKVKATFISHLYC